MRLRPQRRSGPVFLGLAVLAAALAGELGHAWLTAPAGAARLERERAIVRALGLTDTALFTEARYTRNPALADLNSAFQDHPLAFDHFPSASIVPVPALPASGTLSFSDKEPAR
ncbi:hypothetical protein [Acidimangrovimonas pyrenivorans]|uniref:Uncharacterized protein n=1 Tax=Acidimangrovimonas pyrenivorans TaxID=2030798 RepID=A0ABV7AHI4_9RHOB